MSSALDQAQAILDGRLPVQVHSARAAAWVTRSALEEILRDLIRAKGPDVGGANTRTLLSCIDSLYSVEEPETAFRAQYAWDALTQCCHHHAYRLAPTHAEVADLVKVVQTIARSIGWASHET